MEYNDYRVIVTEPAEADLVDIHKYISKELCAPAAARNLVLDIRKVLRTPTFSPQGLPKVRDDRLAAKGYRWIGIKNYVAFFTIDEQSKTVSVERILYGRRDWQRLL
jgi:toxin ParE1/3/4